jgi:hypothetical protein
MFPVYVTGERADNREMIKSEIRLIYTDVWGNIYFILKY